MVRWRLAFAIASVAAAIAIACGPGFLDGISGGNVAGEAPDGTTPIADGGGESDAPATCVSELPPEKKPGDDSGKNLALSFAFDKLRIDTLGDSPAGARPVGLDLDKTCTCPGPDTCVRPSGLPPACDGPKGQDTALSTLFNGLNGTLQIFPTSFAVERIKAGRFTILVDVRGWNGEPDDPAVSVSIRLSRRIDQQAKDGGRPEPLFDGHDLWTVDSSSVTGGTDAVGQDCRDTVAGLTCVAKILDPKAYVSGGKLVARPRVDPTGTLPVPLYVGTAAGPLAFGFYDLIMTATIGGPNGGPYRLDGEMAGRLDAPSYITSVANLQDVTQPGSNEDPLCKNPVLVAALQTSICSARDLAPPGKDSTGSPCTFLSAAFSFSAIPATPGTILKPQPPLTPPCGDASFGCP